MVIICGCTNVVLQCNSVNSRYLQTLPPHDHKGFCLGTNSLSCALEKGFGFQTVGCDPLVVHRVGQSGSHKVTCLHLRFNDIHSSV